jgi:hypothetical protein
MNKITKYKSTDGSEWDTEAVCVERDELCAQVNEAMAPLGDVPEGVNAGKGWLQHDPETVLQAKDAILEICREDKYLSSLPAFSGPGRACHPLSIIGRILDDCGGPLGTAWNRFCRIDSQGREHQQCYYAYTSGPARDHVCLEDRTTVSK